MKIKSTLAALFLAVTAVICLGSCSMNNYSNADKYTTGDREISEKISKIEINWLAGDIKVSLHDKDTLDVSESCDKDLKESRRMHTWVDGDTLHIQFCKSGEMMVFETPKKDLYLSLPKNSELSEFSIDGSSCDCKIDGITADTINSDLSSGKLEITDCKANKIKSDSSSGDVEIELDGDADSISADSSSGSVSITAAKVGNIDVDTSSGKINIDVKEADKVAADASSGDMKFQFENVPKKLRVDASSGDVTICVPKDADFEAEVDTSSGEFYSELALSRDGDTYTAGSGSNSISIDTSSGDVNILVNN